MFPWSDGFQPFVRQRDGKWLDQRVPFVRGDRLRITKGPHAGKIATVSTRFAQMRVDGHWETVLGYRGARGRNVGRGALGRSGAALDRFAPLCYHALPSWEPQGSV